MSKKIYPFPCIFFSGIYKNPVKFTDGAVSSYTGIIKCWFFERLKEYTIWNIRFEIYDLKFNRLSTALSRNFFKGHISFIDFNKAKIILKQDVPYKTVIHESMEIHFRNQEI